MLIDYEILGYESTFGVLKRSFVVEKVVLELLDFLSIVFLEGKGKEGDRKRAEHAGS